MDEAEQDDTLLYDYSNALLFEQMRQYDSMVARLESVVEAENQALADVALYRLARVSFDHFDTTTAMGYIDRLTEDFPESYYTPFGQKTRADVLMSDPDTRDKAVEIYRELLKQHPNYPFTSAVREILRQVEVDQNIG
jgi:tetratricopeptide (TPR) repeat protein